MKFNLTVLDRAGLERWANAFGKPHVNHFTTGSQISVNVASLLLLLCYYLLTYRASRSRKSTYAEIIETS